MPKNISTLEKEIADWQYYKEKSEWPDGKKLYKTFTHSEADEQIANRKAEIARRKAKAEAKEHGGRRTRRRHRTRSTRSTRALTARRR